MAIGSFAELWQVNQQRYGDQLALWDPHSKPETKYGYAELAAVILAFAKGLNALGVKAGDRVAVISENSPRWLICDQGILLAGAVSVPRSADAPATEVSYILSHSGSQVLIAQNAAVLKHLEVKGYDSVILLSDESVVGAITFTELLERGAGSSWLPSPIAGSELATIIYTSGTTGQPKGVMLSHTNLLHQVNSLQVVIQPQPGDRCLSILPTWHTYERTGEYFLLGRGCTLIYTSRRYIKEDLKKKAPHYLVAVPRIFETLYEGILRQFREKSAGQQKLINFLLAQSERYILVKRWLRGQDIDRDPPTGFKKLGHQIALLIYAPLHTLGDRLVYRKVREAIGPAFKQSISGGGSLAKHLDIFYEIIGLEILNGYGLTETAPVLTARRPGDNVRGTAGPPIPDTDIEIVHSETFEPLARGTTIATARNTQGIVMARGPQVMLGYYNNPEATAKVLSPEGWFNTGDLGWLTPKGYLVLTGRAKDTIVLTNGENIEPQPIEDACTRSAYVDQMVVVGQDQKALAALVYPNVPVILAEFRVAIASQAQALSGSDDPEVWAQTPAVVSYACGLETVQKAVLSDLQTLAQARPGYRADERLSALRFIDEPFTMENGLLTQTYKIKRNQVAAKYTELIAAMYA